MPARVDATSTPSTRSVPPRRRSVRKQRPPARVQEAANVPTDAQASHGAVGTPSQGDLRDGPVDGATGAAGAGATDAAAGGNGLGGRGSGRAPGLLAGGPCRGYFPARARADHGVVRIDVEVDAAGRARDSRLLRETPRGQGFGPAARACAAALRFAPATDDRGTAIAGHAKLELRFDRS